MFTARSFTARDRILDFEPGPLVDRDALDSLSPWEREHLAEVDIGLWRVLPEPRCYLNHACEPNAVSTDSVVTALRDIAAGEEITIDYRLNAYDDGAGAWVMACECDPGHPHQVVGEFFSLPAATQERYLEWAPPFIREMYVARHRLK
ncbi:MAG TPA: SET domain-containing protein-lysine N-methyltransferase [Candidatus Limnocylindria bacterium]